jgi:hypothetical protein
MTIEEEAKDIERTVVLLIRDMANTARVRIGNRPYDYTGVPVGQPVPLNRRDS